MLHKLKFQIIELNGAMAKNKHSSSKSTCNYDLTVNSNSQMKLIKDNPAFYSVVLDEEDIPLVKIEDSCKSNGTKSKFIPKIIKTKIIIFMVYLNKIFFLKRKNFISNICVNIFRIDWLYPQCCY